MRIPVIAAALLALAGCRSEQPPAVPEAPATAPRAAAPSGPPSVKEEEMKTTSSGLKYAVLKAGSGAEVKTHQEAQVHYTGWLKDGTKFDSSRDRGEPLSFVIDESPVIQGWHEGIKGMKVGEQRLLVIPPDLAYGDSPPPGAPIPPGATLLFDVELMQIGEHSH